MVENPDREIKVMTWGLFDALCEQLADKIKNKFSKIKYITGIPRGGLPIAIRLSHLLDIKFIEFNNAMQLSNSRQCLVVDDISDSGNTFKNKLEDKKFETAAIFIRKGTKFIPDIYEQEIDEEWIKFPWEKEVKKR